LARPNGGSTWQRLFTCYAGEVARPAFVLERIRRRTFRYALGALATRRCAAEANGLDVAGEWTGTSLAGRSMDSPAGFLHFGRDASPRIARIALGRAVEIVIVVTATIFPTPPPPTNVSPQPHGKPPPPPPGCSRRPPRARGCGRRGRSPVLASKASRLSDPGHRTGCSRSSAVTAWSSAGDQMSAQSPLAWKASQGVRGIQAVAGVSSTCMGKGSGDRLQGAERRLSMSSSSVNSAELAPCVDERDHRGCPRWRSHAGVGRSSGRPQRLHR
jgi:hypothetical protein